MCSIPLSLNPRTGMDQKFPDSWSVVKVQLDSSLKEFYQEQRDAGVKMMYFLRNKRNVLSLYVAKEDVETLAKAATTEVWGDYSKQVQNMMTFETGRCMFSDVWLGCARSIYIADVKKSLGWLGALQF